MKHLKEVKSSYLNHFVYAIFFSFVALAVFVTGIIHAFFPWWFAVTPYKLSKYIVDETEKQFGLGDKDE
jgi:hypothetical protein|tara:strand:- start:1283 stop:1489 length:207 start_codon:yes stop_codon:yes gene_type:complete